MEEVFEIEKYINGPIVKSKTNLKQEFAKRLKYAKEIIAGLMKKNSEHNQNGIKKS